MSTNQKLAALVLALSFFGAWRAQQRPVAASMSLAIVGQGPSCNAQWMLQQLTSTELAGGLSDLCEKQHPEQAMALKDAAYRLQSEHRLMARISSPNTLEVRIQASSPQQAVWLCQGCEQWLRARLQNEAPKLPPELLDEIASQEAKLEECEARLKASIDQPSGLPTSFGELRYQEAYARLRLGRERAQAWLEQACRDRSWLLVLSPPGVED